MKTLKRGDLRLITFDHTGDTVPALWTGTGWLWMPKDATGPFQDGSAICHPDGVATIRDYDPAQVTR